MYSIHSFNMTWKYFSIVVIKCHSFTLVFFDLGTIVRGAIECILESMLQNKQIFSYEYHAPFGNKPLEIISSVMTTCSTSSELVRRKTSSDGPRSLRSFQMKYEFVIFDTIE